MFEDRIARGVAMLNEKRPGWVKKIRLSTLSLVNANACVLGQVEGGFDTGLVELGFTLDQAEEMGFVLYRDNMDLPGQTQAQRERHGYKILTDEWKARIHELKQNGHREI